MNRIRQEPSPYTAKRFSIIRSVGKQVGLGKLPLATCPAKAPHLDFTAPRGNGYPQVSPRTMDGPPPGPPGLMSFRLLQPATSVIPGFPSSRQAALLRVPRFLPCGATRLDSRFFPTGASIAAAGSSAPLERDCARRGLDLGLCPSEAFLAKRRAACRPGYPPGGIRSIYPASEGCKPLFTEV